ncbi:MAG: hypothetical protein HKN26_16635 [Acidimicrobiales bacterium]|nr:hypothetical protein [Acidimicrobiales bacterium]
MPARKNAIWRLLSVLLAFSLLAAACGGDDDDDDGAEPNTTEAVETPATDGVAQTIAPTDPPETGPVAGGTLRIGTEAEVDGVNPTTSALSAPGLWMGITVFDTLTVYLPDGSVAPYLAESIEPSEDLKSWTLKVREGISFHDGSPLNADALIANFESQIGAPLVGLAVRPFYEDQSVEGATPAIEKVDEFTVKWNLLDPDANFPASLTGQLGMVASPTWLADSAAADGGLDQAPVGTGPFKFESREQDSVTRFVRNDDWWGIGVVQDDIYLDAVEFYPLTDTEQRLDQLLNDDLEIIHTTVSSAVSELEDRSASGEVQAQFDDSTEESFAMINSSVPPFDDIRARQALTFATPRDAYNEIIAENVNRPANGPFTLDSPYYNPDVVQEADDPDRAAPLVDEYCAERGTETNPITEGPTCTDGKINIELQWSGPSIVQDRIAELLRDDGWSEFFNVDFDELFQDEHIQQTALGQYNVNTWRQFGAPDPSRDKVWLMCRTAEGISLNWPRFCDEARDALIVEADSGVSEERFIELQQEIAKSMNEAYTYIFFNHTIWAYGYSNSVQNVCGMTGVNDEQLRCNENGRQQVRHMWLAEG